MAGYGRFCVGLPKGVTPLLDLPATLPLPLRIPGVPAVSLSTGHWGTDKSARAAIAACEAMGGAKDCKVAITN